VIHCRVAGTVVAGIFRLLTLVYGTKMAELRSVSILLALIGPFDVTDKVKMHVF